VHEGLSGPVNSCCLPSPCTCTVYSDECSSSSSVTTVTVPSTRKAGTRAGGAVNPPTRDMLAACGFAVALELASAVCADNFRVGGERGGEGGGCNTESLSLNSFPLSFRSLSVGKGAEVWICEAFVVALDVWCCLYWCWYACRL